MKIIKTYESYNLDDLDLGRFEYKEGFAHKIDKSLLIPNEDGTYDYDDDLILTNLNLNSLLEIPIRFKRINGNFICSRNSLLSLEGSPLEVGGDFVCQLNNLISLQYISKEIGGKISTSQNNLISSVHLSNVSYTNIFYGNFSYKDFNITEGAIETVKKMTHEQRIAELDFFKEYDNGAFIKMKKILDSLNFGYGEETRSMVGVMNKDFINAKEMF